ncbi:Gldg family protein [uncultured Maricaulis sp.]|uniref:Gldg family protein n=1 Tax=uncultured Maricaulis sp. TaxID=174710 RepID=UPI0030DB16C5|tara:strand:- start:4284 stop:6131 length:1848 start_codon:yes stop_codon:yes gene_type:complete
MKKALYLPLMLVSIALIFLAGTFLSTQLLAGVRIDLTQNGLYRLSPGTLAVIDRLNEPIEWRFYHSRAEAAQYPAVRSYATRVRELLRTYEKQSGGRIRLVEIDPAPFSRAEDEALAAGLQSLPTDTGERIFFGLVARNSVDDQAVIDLFDQADEARLEYDLTRLISDVDRPERPRLAVLAGLPLDPSDGAPPNRFVSDLNAAYDLQWLGSDFDAIPDAAALLIIHPGRLSEGQLYLIDQFALRRGRVLVFVDPMAHMALRAGLDGLPPVDAHRASGLSPLLANWGIDWDSEAVAMDRTLGLPVEIMDTDGRARRRAYPLWFSIGRAQINVDDLATATLDRNINLGSPGVLDFLPDSGLDVTVLMSTSPDGAEIDADIAAGAPGPDDLLRDYEPAHHALVLGARLRGEAGTAFPDGPPAGDIVFSPADHLTRSETPLDLTVIADVDWIDDTFYLRSDPAAGDTIVADNLTLAMNLVDMAAGDPALIGLRSRSPSVRPMTRVDSLRAEAETRYVEIQDRLEAEIDEAETRLQQLLGSGQASSLADPGARAGRDEAVALRQQILTTRAHLREVEREFRHDIDGLNASLQFWTIGVPPALVILIGILGALFRRRRSAS